MSGDVEREFRAQRAWMLSCRDARALLDRMSEVRADMLGATGEGSALRRLRARDLLELAENRVAQIKAAAIRLRRAPPAAPEPPVRSSEALELEYLRRALAAREARDAERELEQRPPPREVDSRGPSTPDKLREAANAVPVSSSRAPSEQVPSERPWVRSPPTSSTPAPPVTTRPVAGPPASDFRRAESAGARPAHPQSAPTVSPHGSAGGSPRGRPSPTEATEDGPAYTGADVIAHRRRLGLTQRAFALMLGVEQGTVSKGEARAGAPVGAALRQALQRMSRNTGVE